MKAKQIKRLFELEKIWFLSQQQISDGVWIKFYEKYNQVNIVNFELRLEILTRILNYYI
jgi:hypothetical protein